MVSFPHTIENMGNSSGAESSAWEEAENIMGRIHEAFSAVDSALEIRELADMLICSGV